MKRCPECRRDYYDDTLLYCLDDGNALLEGPAIPSPNEAATAILSRAAEGSISDAVTKPQDHALRVGTRNIGNPDEVHIGRAGLAGRPIQFAAVASLFIVVCVFAYWFASRQTTQVEQPPATIGSTSQDDYVRAKVLASSENKTDTEEAIKLLERAVTAEPTFAAGWASLARAYNIKAFYFASDTERKQLNENAEVAVEKALAIDPNLGEAYFVRGLLLWTHSKRFPHEQAIQAYQKALALNPKLDEAHHQLGLIYLHIGLFDKARAEISRALEINQGNTLARFRYGVIDLYRGKYDDAYAFFKSTPLEKNPALHAFQTATVLFQLGRADEATTIIDSYLQDYPNDEGGVGTSVKAMIFAKQGKTREAEDAIKRAEELGKNFGHFHHTAFNIASAYAMLKKADRAVEWLQLAADDGFPCYPLFDNDPNLTNIRQDPKFVSFMSKMKQQWERFNATL